MSALYTLFDYFAPLLQVIVFALQPEMMSLRYVDSHAFASVMRAVHSHVEVLYCELAESSKEVGVVEWPK